MEKLMDKKILTVILLVAGVVIIAAALFLSKDDSVEPEPKLDDDTETPIVPDDDIIIPDKPDDPDPDYVSPEPSEPIEPDEGDDDPPAGGEDDQTPEDTSGFPKPGDGDAVQEDGDGGGSDWQTFHDEEYKFEISYPDTHTVYVGLPEGKAFYINTKDDPEYIEGIFIKLADAAGSADDVIERVEEDNKNDIFSKILADEAVYLFNIKVRKIVATSPRGFHSFHYFFSRNGINYELIVNDENDLCEEIISSFKVIN